MHAVRVRSLEIEGRTGLTAPELWALREVAGEPGGLPLGVLAARLALHKANATRVVDRLEARGLVTRQPSRRDGRVVVARATRTGAARARLGRVPLQADFLARLDALAPRDLAQVERALERLVGLLGAEAAEAPPMFAGDADAPRRPRRA